MGVFEMVQEGLAAVASPSELFLSARNSDSTNAASAAVAVTMEGSRPILLEVQVPKIVPLTEFLLFFVMKHSCYLENRSYKRTCMVKLDSAFLSKVPE